MVVDGDQIMAIDRRALAEQGRLAGGGVVATVMSNLGLERLLDKLELKLERTQVGDRYVMERMREGGFNLGGEQSGHVILSDFSTTGDGMIAALQVLAVMVKSGKPMSTLAGSSSRCRRSWRTCASPAASRWSMPTCGRRSRRPRRG